MSKIGIFKPLRNFQNGHRKRKKTTLRNQANWIFSKIQLSTNISLWLESLKDIQFPQPHNLLNVKI